MKKGLMAVLMAMVLIGTTVGRANAAQPRMGDAVPSFVIVGTTAYCSASITDIGKTVTATMNLWQGSTLVSSWSGTASDSLMLNGTCAVERGKVYTLYVSGTMGEESFFTQPLTVRCEK